MRIRHWRVGVTDDVEFRLGLIGDGIGRSSAPRLHELAGGIAGHSVSYVRFDLDGRRDTTFEDTLAQCAADGLAVRPAPDENRAGTGLGKQIQII